MYTVHGCLTMCKSDHSCYLGRVPYGIRRYSTMYVRHGTITHTGMLLSRNGTTTGRYMILAYDVMQSVRCSDACVQWSKCALFLIVYTVQWSKCALFIMVYTVQWRKMCTFPTASLGIQVQKWRLDITISVEETQRIFLSSVYQKQSLVLIFILHLINV